MTRCTDSNLSMLASHRAAPFLAQLVACGLLGRAEAIAALLHAIAPASVSACGRRARVVSTLAPAVEAARLRRAKAAKAARHALTPLLDARASRRVIRAAVQQAAGAELRSGEIEALTADSIARHLRHARRPSAAGQFKAATDHVIRGQRTN